MTLFDQFKTNILRKIPNKSLTHKFKIPNKYLTPSVFLWQCLSVLGLNFTTNYSVIPVILDFLTISDDSLFVQNYGEGGIRTHEQLPIKRFRIVRFRPLSHLSCFISMYRKNQNFIIYLIILIFNPNLHLSSFLSQQSCNPRDLLQ